MTTDASVKANGAGLPKPARVEAGQVWLDRGVEVVLAERFDYTAWRCRRGGAPGWLIEEWYLRANCTLVRSPKPARITDPAAARERIRHHADTLPDQEAMVACWTVGGPQTVDPVVAREELRKCARIAVESRVLYACRSLDRLALGVTTIGPLDLMRDERDFSDEAEQEDIDGAFYRVMNLVRTALRAEAGKAKAPPIPEGATIDGVAVVPGQTWVVSAIPAVSALPPFPPLTLPNVPGEAKPPPAKPSPVGCGNGGAVHVVAPSSDDQVGFTGVVQSGHDPLRPASAVPKAPDVAPLAPGQVWREDAEGYDGHRFCLLERLPLPLVGVWRIGWEADVGRVEPVSEAWIRDHCTQEPGADGERARDAWIREQCPFVRVPAPPKGKATPPAPPAEAPREWYVIRSRAFGQSRYFAGTMCRWAEHASEAMRFASRDAAERVVSVADLHLAESVADLRLAEIARCRTYWAVRYVDGSEVDYLATYDPRDNATTWTSETDGHCREFATREAAREVADKLNEVGGDAFRVVRVTAVGGCK